MDNFVTCVKGISGSGKSSRVFMLLKYFKEVCNYETEEFFYTNIENKKKYIGIFVKTVNILFLGKYYNSGGIERWQGYDAVTGAFLRSKYLSEFIRDNHNKFSMIIEGAGVTQTNRLRPKFLHDFCGVNNVMMQYYNFKGNHEEYLNRIIYRSGSAPKKGTMWAKDGAFVQEIDFSIKERLELNLKSCYIYDDLFNSPIYDFGVKMFMNFFDEKDIKVFIKYCNFIDYININKFSNFEKK